MPRLGNADVEPGRRVHLVLSAVMGFNHRGPLFVAPVQYLGEFVGMSADGALAIVDAGDQGQAWFLPEDVVAIEVV